MRFLGLTKRNSKGHVTVDYDHIVAIEDNRLSNGLKLEVLETEQEILDFIWRQGQL